MLLMPVFGAVLADAQPRSAAPPTACPMTLAVQQTASSIPPGWSVSDGAATVKLLQFEVYADSPNAPAPRTLLKPMQRRDQARQELTSTWDFSSESTHRRFWVACAYESTTLTLSRQLPLGTSRCTAEHAIGQTGREDFYTLTSTECR